MPRFAIQRIGNDLDGALSRLAASLGLSGSLGDAVFLKPNFTYPFFKPGVTTTREVIEGVVRLLKDHGCRRITLGEGNGGYNSFSMEETFAAYRLDELTARYGLEVVNTSRWPSQQLEVTARRGRFEIQLPRPIFEEYDRFITIPVPKVHAMTTISNAVKNQWGLIQDTLRLQFHVGFDEIITEICRRLPRPLAIVDGTYGLTRNGPMIEGITLDLGWVSACDNLWLNDRLVCELMRMPSRRVSHLRWAEHQGLMPDRASAEIIGDFDALVDTRFYLRRNFWNIVAKSTWYSRSWNRFVYSGRLSGWLHKVMYSIRRKPPELRAKGVDWN